MYYCESSYNYITVINNSNIIGSTYKITERFILSTK